MRLFVVAWREAPGRGRPSLPPGSGSDWRRAVLDPAGGGAAAHRPATSCSRYLDVRPTLDGVEPGVGEAPRARARAASRVLNGPEAIRACHDKLVTALRLGRAGLPHPDDRLPERGLDAARRVAAPLPARRQAALRKPGRARLPLRDPDALGALLGRLRPLGWFKRQGALLQELVPPAGYDLRLLVAGGRAVGASAAWPPPGEWRTNVALGATRRLVRRSRGSASSPLPPRRPWARDLAGVDLIPRPDGSLAVLEVNGAPEFTAAYSLDDRDVFEAVADRRCCSRSRPWASSPPRACPSPSRA